MSIVAGEGLEPTCVATADFKSAASTIPPPSHAKPDILSNTHLFYYILTVTSSPVADDQDYWQSVRLAGRPKLKCC